jgi:hypothetical protein
VNRKLPTVDRAETLHFATTAKRHLIEQLEKAKGAFWRAYARVQRNVKALDKAKRRMDRLLKRIAREEQPANVG